MLAQTVYALVSDGDRVDRQTAAVMIAERMFRIDRIFDALVVIAKQQRTTNKLLSRLGGR